METTEIITKIKELNSRMNIDLLKGDKTLLSLEGWNKISLSSYILGAKQTLGSIRRYLEDTQENEDRLDIIRNDEEILEELYSLIWK